MDQAVPYAVPTTQQPQVADVLISIDKNICVLSQWLYKISSQLQQFLPLVKVVTDLSIDAEALITMGGSGVQTLRALSEEVSNVSTGLDALQQADTALGTAVNNLQTGLAALITQLDNAVQALNAAIAANNPAGVQQVANDLAGFTAQLSTMAGNISAAMGRDTLPASGGTSTPATPTPTPSPTPTP